MEINFTNFFERIDNLLNSIEKIQESLNKPARSHPMPKNITIDKAVIFLNEKGFIGSKSSIYKLTAKKLIPFIRINNRLVFNTKELEYWLDKQIRTSTKVAFSESENISNSARTKLHINHKSKLNEK